MMLHKDVKSVLLSQEKLENIVKSLAKQKKIIMTKSLL